MSGLVELEIPASRDYLALARLVVVSAASIASRLEDDKLDNLRLVVSEACANAIAAHDRIGSSESITIRCDLAEDRVEVEVVDHGPGFDPGDLVELPDSADPKRLEFEHGLGIPLMQMLTDESEIRPTPGGTEVRLVMYGQGDDEH